MGINDESALGQYTFNPALLEQELTKFVQMTGDDRIDVRLDVDGVRENVNTSRVRVNIDFAQLGDYMEWIGRFFCLPPVCGAQEYEYSSCSAFEDAICKPIELCRSSTHEYRGQEYVVDGVSLAVNCLSWRCRLPGVDLRRTDGGFRANSPPLAQERHSPETHVYEPPFEYMTGDRSDTANYVCEPVTVFAPAPGWEITENATMRSDTVFEECANGTWQPNAHRFCPHEPGSMAAGCACTELPNGFTLVCAVEVPNAETVTVVAAYSACSEPTELSYTFRFRENELASGTVVGDNVTEASLDGLPFSYNITGTPAAVATIRYASPAVRWVLPCRRILHIA